MKVDDFLEMATYVGYSDYNGYLGSLDFDTYMDRKRSGKLPEQQQTMFDNNNTVNNKYHTAASAVIPCIRNNNTMPEDMRKEYGKLPSSYKNNIGNLAAESVEAAMNRLRSAQKYRIRTAAAELDAETGTSQLERELAILNWEV
jgi:hypothetical protein